MDSLKEALRRLAKAVVVITSIQDGARYAMTATAVSEVSMDPPAMLACVNRKTALYPVLASGAPFALNILHHSQTSIAMNCAGAAAREERFAEGNWYTADCGVPCLLDAQANIICNNDRLIDYGTHGIVVGQVAEVRISGTPEPLVYVDGRFSRVLEAAV